MCTDCNEITIPTGPKGDTGDIGENAFTVLTSTYIQPAVNTNVTVSVSDTGSYSTGWCGIGQLIFIELGGYYEVVSKTATSITIKYTSTYTTFNQSLTVAGLTVANNGTVSPAGLGGINGTNGTNGTDGVSYTPTTYYINDGGSILEMNSGTLGITDTALVVANLPAGTYIAMFDADCSVTRNTTVDEIITMIYRVNGIPRGLFINPSTETGSNDKLSMNIQFTIAVPTTINVTYLSTAFTDATTKIRIFARSLILLKVA